jgi:hypothetical protein
MTSLFHDGQYGVCSISEVKQVANSRSDGKGANDTSDVFGPTREYVPAVFLNKQQAKGEKKGIIVYVVKGSASSLSSDHDPVPPTAVNSHWKRNDRPK